MTPTKLFKIPSAVTPDNFEEVMEQAITLELATIPTYLSTYYSIQRAPDKFVLFNAILEQLPGGSKDLAEELALDILVYANKTGALIMGVLIEEMLHLALASNVKQAICAASPNLMGIAASKGFIFPTQLDGHQPEFPINLGPLSLKQLATFLKIESPNAFENPAEVAARGIDYTTIGEFYQQIENCITANYPGPYKLGDRLQLSADPKQAIYSPNSINTVYYDKAHRPMFVNEDDSGGLVTVTDGPSALKALGIIVEQGEGKEDPLGDQLKLDKYGMPIPLPVKDGKVVFKEGDYDDPSDQELSHFDKFLEAYSLGYYYEEKFGQHGLKFFDFFVSKQAQNPKQADYEASGQEGLAALSNLGNAIFTYILLMIETCYVTKSNKTQFQIFMFGVHKAMIWLLSEFGGSLPGLTYQKDGNTYAAGLTFEYYDFAAQPKVRPKAQMLAMIDQLAKMSLSSGDAGTAAYNKSLFSALPDIDLDFNVKDIDQDLGIPKT